MIESQVLVPNSVQSKTSVHAHSGAQVSAFIIAVFTVIMLWTEIGAMAGAAIWALAGFFHMALSLEIALGALIAIPAAIVAFWLSRMAWRSAFESDDLTA